MRVIGVHKTSLVNNKEAIVFASFFKSNSPDFEFIMELQLNNFLYSINSFDDTSILVIK
jgi:hypothetical protein